VTRRGALWTILRIVGYIVAFVLLTFVLSHVIAFLLGVAAGIQFLQAEQSLQYLHSGWVERDAAVGAIALLVLYRLRHR
jgi:hypothetical protein